ncbi:hypothetical protein BDA96_05G206600 [Sorghum bicolor]|uniref:BTB domain-containing protein n=1 Tax=Sorghum bicolor TaxID=4558 RepID=A0A921UI57_SORBI|nr:hypothetical protein BDA96_05G206600 [Sorghum bicolor]
MSSSTSVIGAGVKGSHVLKIDGYSRTKGLGNGKSIKSEPFDIGGHSWCIRYFPDGNCTEHSGWISFFLCLSYIHATGVEASITLTLLDDVGEPVPSSYCLTDGIVYTFKFCNGLGFPKFIERKALEESSYLKDDCFRVRMDVTVSMEIRTEGTSQFVMVPPSDMNKHIGRLLSSGVEADVTFQVGDETFAAHRLVLGARSSVFMAELFGPMKEKGTMFRDMLHFIYTDEFPKFDNGDTIAMAQHLLVAADRYDLERLKLMCEHKLCECINTSTVTTTLVLAEQHGCKGLKEACFKFLKSPGNLKTIMDADDGGFQHLTNSCPCILNELLANVAS